MKNYKAFLEPVSAVSWDRADAVFGSVSFCLRTQKELMLSVDKSNKKRSPRD